MHDETGHSSSAGPSVLRDEAHRTIVISGPSSDIEQLNNADLRPRHESSTSSSSRRIGQSISRARSNTEPAKNTSTENGKYVIHLPSSVGSGVSTTSRPLSIQFNTKSSISHKGPPRTTPSPSNRTSSSEVTIKLPSRKQTSADNSLAPESTPTTPLPLKISGKGKEYPSRLLEGPEPGGSSDAHGITKSGGPESVPQSRFVTTSSSRVSLAHSEIEPTTATPLANALGRAFAENALHTPPHPTRPGRRRPLTFVSPALTRATSNASSMQTRLRSQNRGLYVQQWKVPQETGDMRKGQALNQDNLEDFLSADVVDIVFDRGAGIEVDNHVRRLNLRYLLRAIVTQDAVHPSQTGLVGDTDKGCAEKSPGRVPPRFAKFAPSRGDAFLEMLERTFGPDTHWGGGPKPKMVVSDNDDSQAPTEQNGYSSGGETTEIQAYGLGKRRALTDVASNSLKRARKGEVESSSTPEQPTSNVDRALADNWVVSLQGLVKGKTKMNHEQMAFLDDELSKIDRMKAQVSFEVAVDSMLWRTVTQLSELEPEHVPFGDEHSLLERASRLASFWKLKWASEM